MKIAFDEWKHWPGPSRGLLQRRSGNIVADTTSFIHILKELDLLAVHHAVFSVACDISNFAGDKWPGLETKMGEPGVILTAWHHREGVPVCLQFQTDLFYHWFSCLRGIGLTLEGLRKLENHGVVSGLERYLPFQRSIPLPPRAPWFDSVQYPPTFRTTPPSAKAQGTPAPAPGKSPEQLASELLLKISGIYISPVEPSHARLQDAYRAAIRKLHPDVPGTGSHVEFVEMKSAYDLLFKIAKV